MEIVLHHLHGLITDWSVETAESTHVVVLPCTEKETRYVLKVIVPGMPQPMPNEATYFLVTPHFYPVILSKLPEEAICCLLFRFSECCRSSILKQNDSSTPPFVCGRTLPTSLPYRLSCHIYSTPTARMADAQLASKHGAPHMRSCDPDRATHAISSASLWGLPRRGYMSTSLPRPSLDVSSNLTTATATTKELLLCNQLQIETDRWKIGIYEEPE